MIYHYDLAQIINLTFPDPDCNFTEKIHPMKKVLLIILLMMVFGFTQAQNYHPLVDTNKMWSIKHQYGMTPSSDFTKFQGEETIQGYIYKKVWTTTDTLLSNWNPYGYIREDTNKRVYIRYWSGGPDDLRYDFGVDGGDTVYLFSDPMGIFFVVDSVDNYSLITGETRKRINLSCYAGPGGFMGNDTWIEGMGSLYGVMQSGSCALVGDMPQLICFTENDTLKYFNTSFTDCYLITGLVSPESGSESITVFPNPSDGIISVNVNDQSIIPLIMTFYDLTGNQILEKEIKGSGISINLNKLTGPSVVCYQVRGSKGFYAAGKIILLKR
jgi:hypothetical protein